jgi:hypothetical protein
MSRPLTPREVGAMFDALNHKVTVTCSWCHASHDNTYGQTDYCNNCGHRADLPRLQCDCEKCKP